MMYSYGENVNVGIYVCTCDGPTDQSTPSTFYAALPNPTMLKPRQNESHAVKTHSTRPKHATLSIQIPTVHRNKMQPSSISIYAATQRNPYHAVPYVLRLCHAMQPSSQPVPTQAKKRTKGKKFYTLPHQRLTDIDIPRITLSLSQLISRFSPDVFASTPQTQKQQNEQKAKKGKEKGREKKEQFPLRDFSISIRAKLTLNHRDRDGPFSYSSAFPLRSSKSRTQPNPSHKTGPYPHTHHPAPFPPSRKSPRIRAPSDRSRPRRRRPPARFLGSTHLVSARLFDKDLIAHILQRVCARVGHRPGPPERRKRDECKPRSMQEHGGCGCDLW